MFVSKPPKGSFFPHDMQILPKFDERMSMFVPHSDTIQYSLDSKKEYKKIEYKEFLQLTLYKVSRIRISNCPPLAFEITAKTNMSLYQKYDSTDPQKTILFLHIPQPLKISPHDNESSPFVHRIKGLLTCLNSANICFQINSYKKSEQNKLTMLCARWNAWNIRYISYSTFFTKEKPQRNIIFSMHHLHYRTKMTQE